MLKTEVIVVVVILIIFLAWWYWGDICKWACGDKSNDGDEKDADSDKSDAFAPLSVAPTGNDEAKHYSKIEFTDNNYADYVRSMEIDPVSLEHHRNYVADRTQNGERRITRNMDFEAYPGVPSRGLAFKKSVAIGEHAAQVPDADPSEWLHGKQLTWQ